MRFARSDYNGRIVDLQNKIPENEPVFLIRGQDVLGPNTVRFWAKRLEEIGGDAEMVRAARRQAEAMLDWQTDHNFKTPDMPNGAGETIVKAPPDHNHGMIHEIWECTYCGHLWKMIPQKGSSIPEWAIATDMKRHNEIHQSLEQVFNFIVYRQAIARKRGTEVL